MRNQRIADSVERIAYSTNRSLFHSSLSSAAAPPLAGQSGAGAKKGFTSLETIAQRQRRKRFLTGFTLLELLLALGITVVVLVLSYSTFRVGWISYSRLDNQSLVYHNLRGGLYKMRKELSGAFLLEGKNHCLGFLGDREELSFVTLINSRDNEGNIFVEVAKVFYKYENKKLLRAFVKGRDILNTNAAPQYQVFLANLSALEFSYAKGKSSKAGSLIWKSEFTGKDEDEDEDEENKSILPGAVRIKVTQEFNGLPSITLIKSIQLAG